MPHLDTMYKVDLPLCNLCGAPHWKLQPPISCREFNLNFHTRAILLASRAIYSCISRKEPSNTIIIIYIGLCVSYYLTIVSDCQLPFFLFTNGVHGVRACVERSSSGNIQVTYYCPGSNVSEHAQIYVDNVIAVLVTKRVEYMILF